jgi:Winged helix-turn-helix DNA-binding
MPKPFSDQVKDLLVEFLRKHPDMTYKEVSEKMGLSVNTIYVICRERGYRRNRRANEDAVLDALKNSEVI